MPGAIITTKINDDPIKIQSIELAPKVDDTATQDDTTINRQFNVITNGSRHELTVFDVLEAAPEFYPGTTKKNRRINNVKLKSTAADSIYILDVEYVFSEYKTPFHVPIEWEWETAFLEIPAYTDNKGRPCVTEAGEPILGLTRKLKLWVFRGKRNVPGVPPWFRNYGVSMNSDNVKIDGQDFVKRELELQRIGLGGWESQTINRREYRYRPLSFEMWFNPLTWTTEVLNLGFNELLVRRYVDPFGSVKYESFQVRAVNAEGEETKDRVFLDKNGQRPRDDDGNVKIKLDASDITTLKFDLEDELPYTPLLK